MVYLLCRDWGLVAEEWKPASCSIPIIVLWYFLWSFGSVCSAQDTPQGQASFVTKYFIRHMNTDTVLGTITLVGCGSSFFKKRGTKGCVPIIVVSYCLALYVWKFTPESWKWGFNELLNLRSRRSNVGSILAMEQLTSYLPLWACWGGHGRLLIHGLWCTGAIAIQSRCMSIFSAQIQTRFQCVLNSARVAPCSWPFL